MSTVDMSSVSLTAHYTAYAWYRMGVPEAERFATTFCIECGARLPWTVEGGEFVIVPAGSLDDEPESRPERHIYWGSRADWCLAKGELPRFDEVP